MCTGTCFNIQKLYILPCPYSVFMCLLLLCDIQLFKQTAYPLTVIMTAQAYRHTPAPHPAGLPPQSAQPLATETPSDAAAHAFSHPRIKFLHRTVTEAKQYEIGGSHRHVAEDLGLLGYDAVIEWVLLNVPSSSVSLGCLSLRSNALWSFECQGDYLSNDTMSHSSRLESWWGDTLNTSQ